MKYDLGVVGALQGLATARVEDRLFSIACDSDGNDDGEVMARTMGRWLGRMQAVASVENGVK